MSDRAEWLAWRHTGIGASDAAAVHEASPFMTRLQLAEIKICKEVKEKNDNFVLHRGNDIEMKARPKFAALYNMEHGTDEDFIPRRVAMADLDFMLASLDGSSKDGDVLAEFKYMSEPPVPGKDLTPGQIKHQNVADTKIVVTDQKGGGGRVPYHYWIQIQHQLLVANARVCHFVSFDGKTMNTCEVLPDLEFQKLHIKECSKLWELIRKGKLPEPGPRDFKELRVKGMKGRAQQWKKLKVKVAELTEEMEQIRDEILAAVTHDRMTCNGVSIVKVEGRAGAVDYAKILALPVVAATLSANTIDPEAFRKARGSSYYKMDIT